MSALPAADASTLDEKIQDLLARLADSENTLDAIRRGEIDALVVKGGSEEHRVYTLEGADRPYRVLIEQIQEGAITLAEDGTVLYCNRRLANMLEMSQERICGQQLGDFFITSDATRFRGFIVKAKYKNTRSEMVLKSASGKHISVYLSLSLLLDEGTSLICGIITDLTEQKFHIVELAAANARLKAEIAERETAEEHLRQAQKMEAVGQLTGGLAHDFNNLLTGIGGNLELLQARMSQGQLGNLHHYLAAARDATSRAAALTHRLLAFARRQTLAPVATDANRLVREMTDLIRRTAGPAITLKTILASDLWPTLCDPNQLENAVLNLAINARDAMTGGGDLTITTSNVTLAGPAAHDRGLEPGDYIALSVTDTGTGMPPDIIKRAFDPFFTTKPVGLGTGLGLSMIYGFAKQSGGLAEIVSAVNQGTTVQLYLPRHGVREAVHAAASPFAALVHAPASANILVVDDEPSIRQLIVEVLRELGYTVFDAENGPAGMQIMNTQSIDLLITDMGLPHGMNGKQLAEAATTGKPSLKVLFITGYAENTVFGPAGRDPEMHVLTKPFTIETLIRLVRDIF